MSTTFRTIGHEDRLSVVDHLDELRKRLIVCVVTLALAFVGCYAFNHQLLHVVNKPLTTTTKKRTEAGKGPLGQIYTVQKGTRALIQTQLGLAQSLAADKSLPASTRKIEAGNASSLALQLRKFPSRPPPNVPVTLGVSEPFTSTFTIAFYFAVLFALPVILFQLYGFLLPAFSPEEKRVALPLMLTVPFLFIAGLAFGYFLVLPAATNFLQNYHSSSYNILVQASGYYKFAALLLVAMGMIFQLPVGILALTRLGVINVSWLRKNRRYAILVLTVVAAALPGVDPVSMLVELAPLLILYELSIVLARVFGGPERQMAGIGGWFGDDEDEDDDDADDEPDGLP